MEQILDPIESSDPKEDAMKSKKSGGKGKPSDKRSVKNLPPSKTKDVKGGVSNLAQVMHDTRKAVIQNFRV